MVECLIKTKNWTILKISFKILTYYIDLPYHSDHNPEHTKTSDLGLLFSVVFRIVTYLHNHCVRGVWKMSVLVLNLSLVQWSYGIDF